MRSVQTFADGGRRVVEDGSARLEFALDPSLDGRFLVLDSQTPRGFRPVKLVFDWQAAPQPYPQWNFNGRQVYGALVTFPQGPDATDGPAAVSSAHGIENLGYTLILAIAGRGSRAGLVCDMSADNLALELRAENGDYSQNPYFVQVLFTYA